MQAPVGNCLAWSERRAAARPGREACPSIRSTVLRLQPELSLPARPSPPGWCSRLPGRPSRRCRSCRRRRSSWLRAPSVLQVSAAPEPDGRRCLEWSPLHPLRRRRAGIGQATKCVTAAVTFHVCAANLTHRQAQHLRGDSHGDYGLSAKVTPPRRPLRSVWWLTSFKGHRRFKHSAWRAACAVQIPARMSTSVHAALQAWGPVQRQALHQGCHRLENERDIRPSAHEAQCDMSLVLLGQVLQRSPIHACHELGGEALGASRPATWRLLKWDVARRRSVVCGVSVCTP